MADILIYLDEVWMSLSGKNKRLRYKKVKRGYISERRIGAWPRDVRSCIKEAENDVMKIRCKRSREEHLYSHYLIDSVAQRLWAPPAEPLSLLSESCLDLVNLGQAYPESQHCRTHHSLSSSFPGRYPSRYHLDLCVTCSHIITLVLASLCLFYRRARHSSLSYLVFTHHVYN